MHHFLSVPGSYFGYPGIQKIHWKGKSMPYQLFLFAVVGTIGFVVDVTVLYAVIYSVPIDLYSARIVSFLFAASTTWYLNRHFTFGHAATEHPFRQWRRFLFGNAVGGVLNFSTYSILIYWLTDIEGMPFFAVAAGSVAGLIFNFIISRYWVFQSHVNLTSK